jgi:hypothetical protein
MPWQDKLRFPPARRVARPARREADAHLADTNRASTEARRAGQPLQQEVPP